MEIDGAAPDAESMLRGRLGNYGHFTAMQVRGGRVRGPHAHLDRLATGQRELYDAELDRDLVRRHVAHALEGIADASVRVVFFGLDEPRLMVSVDEPYTRLDPPQALMPVDYARPAAHLKHLGGFGQVWHARRAGRAGYDDALLTTSDGVVVESSIANIAFLDDTGVVWAEADWLHGTTMRLLEENHPSRRAVVRLADLRSYRAAFLANSRGIAPVSRIGDVEFAVDPLADVRAAYDAVPWEEF
ncbi:aminotransferase class IV [Actinosynnema sp. NPDC020468]|uniref:aminotransferase class IV n=1 Tax=Actinosynnema sp. NPDC020468 TaxID=3154488 RepID=UPI003401CF30